MVNTAAELRTAVACASLVIACFVSATVPDVESVAPLLAKDFSSVTDNSSAAQK